MWLILLPHVASTTVSGNQLRWAGLEHARWLYTSGDLGGSGLTGWLGSVTIINQSASLGWPG